MSSARRCVNSLECIISSVIAYYCVYMRVCHCIFSYVDVVLCQSINSPSFYSLSPLYHHHHHHHQRRGPNEKASPSVLIRTIPNISKVINRSQETYFRRFYIYSPNQVLYAYPEEDATVSSSSMYIHYIIIESRSIFTTGGRIDDHHHKQQVLTGELFLFQFTRIIRSSLTSFRLRCVRISSLCFVSAFLSNV